MRGLLIHLDNFEEFGITTSNALAADTGDCAANVGSGGASWAGFFTQVGVSVAGLFAAAGDVGAGASVAGIFPAAGDVVEGVLFLAVEGALFLAGASALAFRFGRGGRGMVTIYHGGGVNTRVRTSLM